MLRQTFHFFNAFPCFSLVIPNNAPKQRVKKMSPKEAEALSVVTVEKQSYAKEDLPPKYEEVANLSVQLGIFSNKMSIIPVWSLSCFCARAFILVRVSRLRALKSS